MKLFMTAFILLATLGYFPIERQYVKETNEHGMLISEGWVENGVKNGYWKFYDNEQRLISSGHFDQDLKTGYWKEYKNGKVNSEGHYKRNLKTDWWICYHKMGYRTIKKQYKNGIQNGYALYYKKSSLSMVEEYVADKKIGAWTSYFKFKRDHPGFSLSDLRK